MDDAIFVDLVNGLVLHEKEDKEQAKKKAKEDDKNKKEDAAVKVENDKSVDQKDETPFPSMTIFNVSWIDKLQLCWCKRDWDEV